MAPWLSKTITVLAIAAALAGSMVLGAMMPRMIRPCAAVATAASAANGPAHFLSGSPAHGQARGRGCGAYSTRR